MGRVLRTTSLDSGVLNGLIRGDILAVIVENYTPPDDASKLAENILNHSSVEKYTHEVKTDGDIVQQYFGIDRLGVPFNSVYGAEDGSSASEYYYANARTGIARMRELSKGIVNPIDKLRLDLDENTASGATVASFQGRKMLAGIGRITKAKLSHLSAEQPHFDALPEVYAKLDAQLAANIYLKVPDHGGELEVWDVPPVDPLTQMPEDWRSALPKSQLIKPAVGDLVIFNCRRPHAVQSFVGDDRVTVQMFIGVQAGKPLQLWN